MSADTQVAFSQCLLIVISTVKVMYQQYSLSHKFTKTNFAIINFSSQVHSTLLPCYITICSENSITTLVSCFTSITEVNSWPDASVDLICMTHCNTL